MSPISAAMVKASTQPMPGTVNRRGMYMGGRRGLSLGAG
jgi:hypothetical protein